MRNAHKKAVILSMAVAGAAVSFSQFSAEAQSYSWLNFAGGTYDWNTGTNWSPTGVPMVSGDTANIEGNVTGGPLNINISSSVNVGTLFFGSGTNAFATTIGTSGGTLILDAGAGSTAFIRTTGPIGLTNFISAPVQVSNSNIINNFNVTMPGSANLTFSGPITNFVDNESGDEETGLTRSLLYAVSGGTVTYGTISLTQTGAVTGGTLVLGVGRIPNATETTDDDLAAENVSIVLNGPVSNGPGGGSRLAIGNTSTTIRGSGVNPPTVYLRGANTHTGGTVLGRGKFVVENNNAFGEAPSVGTWSSAHILQTSRSQAFHTELQSNDDSRTIPNIIQFTQNLTFSGQNSLKLTGGVYQTNSRSMVNLLPAGKTLTLEGLIAIGEQTDTTRPITFDGEGTTILNGPIYNHRNPWIPGYNSLDNNDNLTAGALTKRGSGVLIVDPTILPTIGWGTLTATGASSTYRGNTLAAGGLLQFANSKAYGQLDADYNSGSFATRYFDEAFLTNVETSTSISIPANTTGTARIIVPGGGAVGILTGINQAFLDKLNASTLGNSGSLTGNTGALALAPVDAAKNFDYTGTIGGAVNLSSATLSNMSLGATANGTTFTGSITLGATQTSYRLGGGGTLTLPNTNQLTGTKNLLASNGGTVKITGTNNYSLSTIIGGNYLQTGIEFAKRNGGTLAAGSESYAYYQPTTLEISSIADAGTVSSIGSINVGTNTANRLTFRGGTLKYVGPAASTNRLFTVGTTGATIDSSGTGALVFTNAGSISLEQAADRAGTLSTGASENVINDVTDYNDLTLGMTVDDTAGTFLSSTNPPSIVGIIPGIQATTNNQVAQVVMSGGSDGSLTNVNLTFRNQDRALKLAGSNTADNTMGVVLRDLVVSGSTIGQLGITKAGAGKWIVTGNNTHTGTTTLQGGTLQFNTLANLGADTYNEGSISNGATKVTFEGGALLWGPGNTADISQRVVKIGKGGGTFDTGANNVNFASGIGDDGEGALHKQGSGRLTLNGITSNTGGTNVHAGTLAVNHQQALGFGVTQKPGGNVGTSTVNGGVLDISGQTLTEAITLNGGTLGNSGGSATITSGVKGVAIVKGGSDLSGDTTVSFGGGSGAAAQVSLGLTDAAFTITNAGAEYVNAPDITITGGGGTGAEAEAVMQNTDSGGGTFQNVASIRITNPGTGYTSAPTITIAAPDGGGGTQATATADDEHFTLVSLTQTAAGSGYLSGASVTLGSSTGANTVQLGTPVTSSVTLLSTSSIGGSGDINILSSVSGAGGLQKVGAGTVILNNASYTGGTTVKQGRLHLKGTSAWNPSLAGTGTDVQGGAVIYDYSGGGSSPQSTIVPVLTANRATNFAAGIVRSSTATATKGLGWKDTASQFTVAYTYYGDIDLNFDVDSTDFNAFVAGYGKTSGAIWADGDFDYDGKVNTRDFNWLAGNFGEPVLGGALPSAALGAVVPEPASLGVVGLALTALMGRRRR